MWRSGSASPCQGEGREFESRHPLECWWSAPADRGMWATTRGGVAERRGSGLQSRPHGFESRRHLNHQDQNTLPDASRSNSTTWAIGAAVARFPDTEEVTGSIPVSPTEKPRLGGAFSVPRHRNLGSDLATACAAVALVRSQYRPQRSPASAGLSRRPVGAAAAAAR